MSSLPLDRIISTPPLNKYTALMCCWGPHSKPKGIKKDQCQLCVFQLIFHHCDCIRLEADIPGLKLQPAHHCSTFINLLVPLLYRLT